MQQNLSCWRIHVIQTAYELQTMHETLTPLWEFWESQQTCWSSETLDTLLLANVLRHCVTAQNASSRKSQRTLHEPSIWNSHSELNWRKWTIGRHTSKGTIKTFEDSHILELMRNIIQNITCGEHHYKNVYNGYNWRKGWLTSIPTVNGNRRIGIKTENRSRRIESQVKTIAHQW